MGQDKKQLIAFLIFLCIPVIWFGLTWSLEEYQQANKRLHRQGQQFPVIIHRLIVQGGTDEDVIRSLESKDGAQEALLAALKARVDRAKEGLPG